VEIVEISSHYLTFNKCNPPLSNDFWSVPFLECSYRIPFPFRQKAIFPYSSWIAGCSCADRHAFKEHMTKLLNLAFCLHLIFLINPIWIISCLSWDFDMIVKITIRMHNGWSFGCSVLNMRHLWSNLRNLIVVRCMRHIRLYISIYRKHTSADHSFVTWTVYFDCQNEEELGRIDQWEMGIRRVQKQ